MPKGPSHEAKERAAAIAAANRGRGFKSRLGGAAMGKIFMEAPKPKQSIAQVGFPSHPAESLLPEGKSADTGGLAT